MDGGRGGEGRRWGRRRQPLARWYRTASRRLAAATVLHKAHSDACARLCRKRQQAIMQHGGSRACGPFDALRAGLPHLRMPADLGAPWRPCMDAPAADHGGPLCRPASPSLCPSIPPSSNPSVFFAGTRRPFAARYGQWRAACPAAQNPGSARRGHAPGFRAMARRVDAWHAAPLPRRRGGRRRAPAALKH